MILVFFLSLVGLTRFRSCPSTCAKIVCDALPSQSSGGSGTSPGALAGAVIGALLFLSFIVLGYLYYRRREAAKEAAAKEKATVDVKPDIPARADAVLSRPDPHLAARSSKGNGTEKSSPASAELGTVRLYSNQSNTTINLDPSQGVQSSAVSTRSNPFADGASIQTASGRSQSTNVIPIALVPPGSHQGHSGTPLRAPEVVLNGNGNMNLEHIDAEGDGLRVPYASSARSGISGKSFMTTSSIATDLDEPPQIMTPKEGVVRQVFGVSQAQVVRVPSNGSASKSRAARGGLNRHPSKATIGRSPLAQQSFTPADIPLTNRDPVSPTTTVASRGNPFTDPVVPRRDSFADSSRSTDTFGSPNEYHSEGPFTPRPGATFAESQNQSNHRVSVASTVDVGSIRADIGTASRVILGMQSPSSFSGGALSPGLSVSQSRATSMQTNSGRTIVSLDHDDDGFSVRPHSVLSGKTTSSRADSVLAGFPFVPPSPISALPPRSPGAASTSNPVASPSSVGSMFARQQALSTPLNQNGPPSSPTSTTTTLTQNDTTAPRGLRGRVPPPESRSISASSSGLETYPFQFEDQPATPNPPEPMTNRASLDTIALTRDLTAFPLEYEGYDDNNTKE
ncbi:hypothetical protein BU17DRAFT_37347 [Hysterangium stoloniferum]|nr:hypothetical protein BU17DRAFT_37347 [Hysterangium stoloniferum]